MAEGMSRYKSVLFVLAVSGSIFSSAAEARIMSIAPPDSAAGGGLHNPYWVFDYELQHLTIVGDVYLRSSTGSDAPDPGGGGGGTVRRSGETTNLQVQCYGATVADGVPWGEPIYNCVGDSIRGFAGGADSDSVLHVTGIFKNKTGLTWTGWMIEWGAPYIWDNPQLEDIVYVNSSKFEVVAHSGHRIILSGEQRVLTEEAFTFSVDVYVGEGSFYDDLAMAPMIPEPATVVLFGVGGIAVLERQRRRRRWLKA